MIRNSGNAGNSRRLTHESYLKDLAEWFFLLTLVHPNINYIDADCLHIYHKQFYICNQHESVFPDKKENDISPLTKYDKAYDCLYNKDSRHKKDCD